MATLPSSQCKNLPHTLYQVRHIQSLGDEIIRPHRSSPHAIGHSDFTGDYNYPRRTRLEHLLDLATSFKSCNVRYAHIDNDKSRNFLACFLTGILKIRRYRSCVPFPSQDCRDLFSSHGVTIDHENILLHFITPVCYVELKTMRSHSVPLNRTPSNLSVNLVVYSKERTQPPFSPRFNFSIPPHSTISSASVA